MDGVELEQVLERLERIKHLSEQLAKAHGDLLEQQDIATRLQREIEAAKNAIQPFAAGDKLET